MRRLAVCAGVALCWLGLAGSFARGGVLINENFNSGIPGTWSADHQTADIQNQAPSSTDWSGNVNAGVIWLRQHPDSYYNNWITSNSFRLNSTVDLQSFSLSFRLNFLRSDPDQGGNNELFFVEIVDYSRAGLNPVTGLPFDALATLFTFDTDALDVLESYSDLTQLPQPTQSTLLGKDLAVRFRYYDGDIHVTGNRALIDDVFAQSAGSAAVPEPSTSALLAMAAVGFAARLRRRPGSASQPRRPAPPAVG